MFAGADPTESTLYRLSVHGPAYELGPHFRLIEFASRDGHDGVLVHRELIDLLEEMRGHFAAPVFINSGYRTPAHNRAIGGVSRSIHCLGMAADIRVRGVSPATVQRWAEDLGIGGVGCYRDFTHVDVYGHGRRWSR